MIGNWTVFVDAIRHDVKRRNCVWFGVVLAVIVFVIELGLWTEGRMEEEIRKFQKLDAMNGGGVADYRSYRLTGHRFFFSPSPLMALTHPGEMAYKYRGRIDGGITLEINGERREAVFFAGEPFSASRWVNVIYFLGSLWAFYFGFSVFFPESYMRFLLSRYSRGGVYAARVAARLLIIVVISGVAGAVIRLQFLLHGEELSPGDVLAYWAFILQACLLWVFFYSVGAAMGNVWTDHLRLVKMAITWSVLVLIIPMILHLSLVSLDNKEDIRFGAQRAQLEELLRFEEQARPRLEAAVGEPEKMREELRRLALEHRQSCYPRIEKSEDRVRESCEKSARLASGLTMFFPPCHFMMCADELSSAGSGSFLAFYRFLQEKKRSFVHFLSERGYITDRIVQPGHSQPERFIDINGIVFRAEGVIPWNYGYGWGIGMLYSLGIMMMGFHFYRRRFFPVFSRQGRKKFEKLDIHLFKPDQAVLDFCDKIVWGQFLNILNGYGERNGGRISLDGREFAAADRPRYLHIPAPSDLPRDLKTSVLLKRLAALLELRDEQVWEISIYLGGERLGKRFGALEPLDQSLFLIRVFYYAESDMLLFEDLGDNLNSAARASLSAAFEIFREKKAAVLVMENRRMPWLDSEMQLSVMLKEDIYQAKVFDQTGRFMDTLFQYWSGSDKMTEAVRGELEEEPGEGGPLSS